MNPEKKISFGFNKLGKKPTLINKPEEKKLDYVLSLEGQSLKLKDEKKEVEKEPLIIPLKDDKKDLLDRVREMKAKEKSSNSKNQNKDFEDTRPDSELTIEELAAREVVRDAKLRLAQSDSKNNKVFVLPMKKDDELPLEGEKESTLTDYENVPVNDFGLAMLRGMGWQEGIGIGKNPTKTAMTKAPELRPKGLGLGASSMVNAESQKQLACDADGKALILKKGCYGKIIAGNNKGNYCEVQGLDDEAGRVVVKTSLKGDVLTLSEFMVIPVTKEEYSRNSKVINSAKFEEYKEMEERKIKLEKNDNHSPHREDTYKREDTRIKKERSPTRDYTNTKVKTEKTDKHSSEDESSRRSSSTKDKKHLEKHSKKYDSSDSDNERSRRIHKRKDKRRHRDKSRSPYKTKYKSSKKSSKSKHRHRSSSSDSSEYEKKSKSRNRRDSSSDDNRSSRRNKR